MNIVLYAMYILPNMLQLTQCSSILLYWLFMWSKWPIIYCIWFSMQI